MKFLAINPKISTDVWIGGSHFSVASCRMLVKLKLFDLFKFFQCPFFSVNGVLGDHYDLFKLRTLTLLLVPTDSCNIT